MAKTPAQLDREIAVALAKRTMATDLARYTAQKKFRNTLRTAIRKNLRTGMEPCAAARAAIYTLGLSERGPHGVGVMGDDDKRDDNYADGHIELHFTDGERDLGLSINRNARGVWTV